MTVGGYLEAVAEIHGLTFRAMARALKVNPTVLRRWRRDAVVPSWRRTQAMTALWGGNPHVIFLGSMLQRYCAQTGVTLAQARRLCVAKAAALPQKRRPRRSADRAQLQLPM